MDHSYIEEHNLVERYVRGTLPATERTAFEEHFLDCPECLDKMEIARSLRKGIRIAAADMVLAPEAAGSTLGGWLRSFFGWRRVAAVAAACLVIASLTGVVLYRQLVHTRNELDRAQLAFVRERENARAVLRDAQQDPLLVYVLNQSRGAGEPKMIELPRSPKWVVLSIEADVSQFSSYGAILQNQNGQVIWRGDVIQPSSPDMIAVPVLSTLLTPGAWTLRLEGRDAAGRHVPMFRFSLQVKEPR
jgi:hypothetical protein